MKLRCNRQEMAEALSVLCTVASPRTPKEVLKCVRVEVHSDVLLLSATDLELSLRCALTQVEVEKPGDTLVVAETLARIARECADEILVMELEGNNLHIRGEGSHFQIVTQDAADFPAIPTMEDEPDIVVEFDRLRRMVELTAFAAARESTRYAINGVLWEFEGEKLTMSATDGRRLAVVHGQTDGPSGGRAARLIVPSKTLSLIGRLNMEPDGRAGIKMSEHQLLLNLGRVMISSSLVEGQFPSYQDVIPSDCDRLVKLETSSFLSSLKRAALLTNEESKGVRFSFSEGSLTMSSRAPEQGEAEVALSVDYHDEPMEIGFNPAYLLDVLRVAPDEAITLELKDSNRPGVIKFGGDYVYVVMPVNLTSA